MCEKKHIHTKNFISWIKMIYLVHVQVLLTITNKFVLVYGQLYWPDFRMKKKRKKRKKPWKEINVENIFKK